MLYTILCYNDEDVVWSWTKEQDDAVMGRIHAVREKLIAYVRDNFPESLPRVRRQDFRLGEADGRADAPLPESRRPV